MKTRYSLITRNFRLISSNDKTFVLSTVFFGDGKVISRNRKRLPLDMLERYLNIGFGEDVPMSENECPLYYN